jgi:hypothetical protein
MTPILTSWARLGLLAVPFADPALIGFAETPEAEKQGARESSHPGVVREASASEQSRPPVRDRRPA